MSTRQRRIKIETSKRNTRSILNRTCENRTNLKDFREKLLLIKYDKNISEIHSKLSRM